MMSNANDNDSGTDMKAPPPTSSKSTTADGRQRMHGDIIEQSQYDNSNITTNNTPTAVVVDAPSSSEPQPSSSTTPTHIVDSTQTYIVNAESQLVGTAAAAAIAPQPPQWRFVSRAKKTEGFSSVYAGLPVRGEFD